MNLIENSLRILENLYDNKRKVLFIGHVKLYNRVMKLLLTFYNKYNSILLESEQLFEN